MWRWLLVIFLVLMLVNTLTPWFHKLGFGRLPGDIRFKLLGRDFFLPLTSTIVLSLVAAAIARFI